MSSQSGRGGGRDRDKNRKYESGAAKRKAKEERVARESKVLSKSLRYPHCFPQRPAVAILVAVQLVPAHSPLRNPNPFTILLSRPLVIQPRLRQ